jgi:hypothetical protein
MKSRKPYWEMNASELAKATKVFDRELPDAGFRPLTPGLRTRVAAARRKPGRPRIGRGARRVLVTIEGELLERADSFARKRRISRAQLIAHGLRAVLPKAG